MRARAIVYKRLARLGPYGLVAGGALLYAVVISFLSIYKHEIFASARFDLGNMDQAVWNTAHGRLLQTTDDTGELVSRLQNHADFLLLAFVPLYLVWASPYWLLVAQAVVVGLGALPLYWLARRFLRDLPCGEWVAAAVAVAYLLNPGLQSANLFDFHAQTMAPTFLLFTFYYMLKRRVWAFVGFGVLAALCKEEISLIVAMMGLYAIWPLRRPGWGVPTFAAGVGYFLVVMLVVIPAFNVGATSSLVEGRYSAFGGSMAGVLTTALSDPLFTLSYVFSGERPLYLLSLIGMSGFLGIFSPLVLLTPLPELAINLLSDRAQMTSIRYQYVAPILPFMYLAAASGLANLLRWLGRLEGRFEPLRSAVAKLPAVFAVAVLLGGVQLTYEMGPLPLFNSPNNHASVIEPPSTEHLRALEEAVAMVPEGASVAATNNVGAHLAHRRYLYLLPTVGNAEYVVVDGAEPSYSTEISPVLTMATVESLQESGEYRKVFSENGVLVLKRR